MAAVLATIIVTQLHCHMHVLWLMTSQMKCQHRICH